MHLRRGLTVLFTALTLFGGGATLSACQAAGQDQNDGTTDDSGNTSEHTQQESDNPEGGQEDPAG